MKYGVCGVVWQSLRWTLFLEKFTTDRHISRGRGFSPISGIWVGATPKTRLFEPFWSENRYDFDHYSLKSAMVFKGTTRAYKCMENGMFWSEIALRF